jgi:hypothetical protein
MYPSKCSAAPEPCLPSPRRDNEVRSSQSQHLYSSNERLCGVSHADQIAKALVFLHKPRPTHHVSAQIGLAPPQLVSLAVRTALLMLKSLAGQACSCPGLQFTESIVNLFNRTIRPTTSNLDMSRQRTRNSLAVYRRRGDTECRNQKQSDRDRK